MSTPARPIELTSATSTDPVETPWTDDAKAGAEARARQSCGTSGEAIYRMVCRAIAARHSGSGTLIDVGCGTGSLWTYLHASFERHVGVDVVRYDRLPDQVEFHQINLDSGRASLPEGSGDVVVAVETIEHLENPRAFVRELTRLAKPNGWIVVTTPNQLSLLSKLTLVVKGQFNAFQAGNYPAHLTALLESDLRRIATELSWTEIAVAYTGVGRIPGTARTWPRFVSGLFPRAFSDNLLITGRKSTIVLDPARVLAS